MSQPLMNESVYRLQGRYRAARAAKNSLFGGSEDAISVVLGVQGFAPCI